MIVIAGPPGAGKSTILGLVAEAISGAAKDLDVEIERTTGRAVSAMIRESGEAAFRRAEVDALRAVPSDLAVLALGGGTLVTDDGRRAARRLGPVAGLVASPDVLARRLESDSSDRPLANDLAALLRERREAYAAVDFSVDASRSPEVVAAELVERGRRLETIEVTISATTTRVVVGRDIADAVGGAVASNQPTRPVVAIVDGGVPEDAVTAMLDSVRTLYPVIRIDVAGGERVKTWKRLESVVETALDAGAGRQSVVLGIGGGATTDLAGFAASMLGRGAPLVLVPTTVLAQADAAVGGKCAINTGAGRNLVGAFHAATDVVVDLDLVETLDEDEARSGLAELLKIAIIGDEKLFARLVRGEKPDVSSMARAIELKGAIVEQDPFESGVRKNLNLGHTLAHALETASAHTLRHGEAVAIGIAAAVRYGVERGWTPAETAETVISGLEAVGLPTHADTQLLAAASAWIDQDKKGSRTHIALIAVHGLEDVRSHDVPLKEVRQALVRHGGRP